MSQPVSARSTGRRTGTPNCTTGAASLDDRRLVRSRGIQIEPFTAKQAQIARQAYRDYGKGSGHPARLNFGDCMSYALASVTGQPLLFKGDDFGHTDVVSALA